MIQVFKTDEDYKKWLNGQTLPSGIVVYVSDNETMYFSTNNIKGELKTYKCEKEEPIIYPPLVYSTNAAGSTITVNGETMTLEQGDNITLEYPTAITSVKATSNTALTYIQIPNTVTSIDNNAFGDCDALSEITIPDSVKSIGVGAFQFCIGLTSINIPSGVTSISMETFNGCSALASVTLPEGLTNIGSSTFMDCTSLASITIPSSVTMIDFEAFNYCEALTDFNFNGTMAQWGAITLGTNWKNNAAFTVVHCTDGDVSLEEPIQYPPLVYSTNAAGSTITVNGQSVTLEQGENIVLDYPNEITSVKASYNSALTYIQIPNTVTSIESDAFNGCSSLASVNIPDTVTSIGDSAFRGCNKLASITIPDGVTSIESEAFQRCNKLTDFNYNGTMEQWASITLGSGWCISSLKVVHCSDGYVLTEYGIPTTQVDFSTNAAGSTITVNGETVTLNRCNNCALPYANEITSINATNNTALTMIKLPNTITSIDNNSFANCISLSFIIISDSITSINEKAFYGCTTLTDFIYSGTKAQWASITLGTDWKYNAGFSKVHCTDGDVTL